MAEEESTSQPPIAHLESPQLWPKDTPWQPQKKVSYSPLPTNERVSAFMVEAAAIKAESEDGFPFHVKASSNEQQISGQGNGHVKPIRCFPSASQSSPAGNGLSSGNSNGGPPASQGNWKKPSFTGISTPPRRRSVQFARPAMGFEQRSESWDNVNSQDTSKDRRSTTLFGKLRALATTTPGPPRSVSGFTVGDELTDDRSPAPLSPDSEVGGMRFEDILDEEGSDLDADAEQSPAEDSSNPNEGRKRRKSRRPQYTGTQTAPTTPRTHLPLRPGLPSNSSLATMEPPRVSVLPRRSTMTDMVAEQRQGVSEDEGRTRLNRDSPWRRGSAWLHGPHGLSYGSSPVPGQHQSTEPRRPSNFRRMTGLTLSNARPGERSPFSPWKLNDRTSSISAAKWQQLKTALRLTGRKRMVQNTVDQAKSAELLAELTAGVPAALILASMFQRDEHGNRRIPILLEQLKVRITDSRSVGDRHMIFRIELEYGNGLTRMKWVIHRALRDFVNLHGKYKFQQFQQRKAQQIKTAGQTGVKKRPDDTRAKMPHFPRSAFPYLKGIRGLGSDSDEEEVRDEAGQPTSGEASANEKPSKKMSRGSSTAVLKRAFTSLSMHESRIPNSRVSTGGLDGSGAETPARKDPFPERQRKKLELYLQQMIRYLIFRPDSNRLCKFLELSALGVRLAAEGSYHGKEGLMIIQSAKGIDFRRALTPSMIKHRHGPKWFLVRHSYIVCVDSPEDMNIYEVFLVDEDFELQSKRARLRDAKPQDLARTAKESAAHAKHHSLKLRNSERTLKLLARNERQLHQFEESIKMMSHNTPWSKPNRFGSFAPIRSNVYCQWLVDGRSYMWNVSRAISMAKHTIYIHDWWLSPELYLRRPAAISRKWRLDRLLRDKAREGVKVFVIVYRNIESAVPIDSEHTKISLLELDSNVFVQRSPNQLRQNTFFWAHHEKICVVDQLIAFVGGIDLCFGRWDTPQHSVRDDKLTGFEQSDAPKDADHCQLWPGKDYSNPRVQDFYALDKPYEEMYDRSRIPRMPWHDVSMQIVGQPARDLSRHFVQRWNFILRQRKPTRPTPFLLPPPDFDFAELEALGLKGSCDVQILRSCAPWSIGTPNKVEHSILTAYVKLIEESEHFVYIENQFFISSCEVETTKIENSIGDALVERIIKAHTNGEDWRACIIIPLMPGFQNTVDQQDGTSVRLIMQCQYRSICRGDYSIFGRLRAHSIDPIDYIEFYALRAWGKIGPTKHLVTEQLYIHAKCMIVDDRHVIIGSANINERSMLGSRDSECAAVIRDRDEKWSIMGGEPYLVGRFAHSLRMRLMREHLGLEIDEGAENDDPEDVSNQEESGAAGASNSYGKTEQASDMEYQDENEPSKLTKIITPHTEPITNTDGHLLQPNKAIRRDRRSTLSTGRSSDCSSSRERNSTARAPLPPMPRTTTSQLGLPLPSQLPPLPDIDDTDIGGPPARRVFSPKSAEIVNPIIGDIKRPFVDKHCMRDPLNDSFMIDTWHAVAENNTKLFRTVFRCMPDNEVKDWKGYKEFSAYALRFSQSQVGGKKQDPVAQHPPSRSGPPGAATTADKLRMLGPLGEKAGTIEGKLEALGAKVLHGHPHPEKEHQNPHPLGRVEEWAAEAEEEQQMRQERDFRPQTEEQRITPEAETLVDEKSELRGSNDGARDLSPLQPNPTFDSEKPQSFPPIAGYVDVPNTNGISHKRRRRATTRSSKRAYHASDDILNTADAEEVMKMVQGNLVIWPYDWYVG